MEKIKIAVSACLLGHKVRHDQSHRHDAFLTGTLSQFCELIPICPEVESGLGLPREAMHLELIEGKIKLIGSKSGKDLSMPMHNYAEKKLRELSKTEFYGYILKKRSPSCGLSGIAIIEPEKKKLVKMGAGVYTEKFLEAFPQIPVIDDGRLHHPELREAFFEKVFIMHHWHQLAKKKKIADLVSFHTWHKFTLMAHHPNSMRQMGKLIGDWKKDSDIGIKEIFDQYFILLDKTLSVPKTVKKNVDVMLHLIGHFKKELESDEKEEFLQLVEHYRAGDLPILVPLTLLKHFARKYQKKYVVEQHYLSPHPVELRLRNLL